MIQLIQVSGVFFGVVSQSTLVLYGALAQVRYDPPQFPKLNRSSYSATSNVITPTTTQNMDNRAMAADQDRGPLLLGVSWTLATASFLFVSLRVHGRLRLTRNLWWDDWLMIVTMVSGWPESSQVFFLLKYKIRHLLFATLSYGPFMPISEPVAIFTIFKKDKLN